VLRRDVRHQAKVQEAAGPEQEGEKRGTEDTRGSSLIAQKCLFGLKYLGTRWREAKLKPLVVLTLQNCAKSCFYISLRQWLLTAIKASSNISIQQKDFTH
jgi:hypothetical protein